MVKKILKSKVFLVITTIILTAGTTVFGAIVYNANQIGYTPSDASWSVNSVDTALNSLYVNSNNFKSLIATAITNKGIATSVTDSAQTMATNISNISSRTASGMDLLWENPNPTLTFAAQTIALDLSKYEGVMIEFQKSDVLKILRTCCSISDTGWIICSCNGGTKYRSYVPNSTGITFAAGGSHTIWDQGTDDNNSSIPYRIYGVKKMIYDSQSGSSFGMNLIWQNPNPTTAFGAQTVALNLNGYEGVMVEYANSESNKSCAAMSSQGWCLTTCGGGRKYRSYVPDTSGVTFSAGGSHTIWDQGTTDNASTIPYRIYGIKVIPE